MIQYIRWSIVDENIIHCLISLMVLILIISYPKYLFFEVEFLQLKFFLTHYLYQIADLSTKF